MFSEKRKIPGVQLRTVQPVVDYYIPSVSEEGAASIFRAEDGGSTYVSNVCEFMLACTKKTVVLATQNT
jgi:hypothetical protein